MPRTLPAALTTVMDAGRYDPYLRAVINNAPNNTAAVTVQPIGFKIQDTRATVTIPFSLDAFLDEGYFRIVRGAMIDGTPSTISTAWFAFDAVIYDHKFITYTGNLLDRSCLTVAANSTYKDVIDAVLTDIGANLETLVASYEGTAAWKAYQFYPTGRTVVVSPRTKLFTLLQQKYLVFATENGWDDTNSGIYFFVATQTRTTDYTIVDPLLFFNSKTESRYVIWRDESNVVHNTGNATNIIHNLGYLESTDDDPITTAGTNLFIGTHTSKLRVHLKYMTGDKVRIESPNITVTERVRVTEVLDTNATPAWYQVLEVLEFFGSTEGGSMPSTIEAAAPYTPLATGNFDGVLSSNDNNLQAAMETIDDHAHDADYAPIAKGVTNGDSHDHVGGDGGALTAVGDVSWNNVGSFSNSWVNYGGSEPVAQYGKDGLGRLFLKGTIKSGTTGATAFTLPAGYRPSEKKTLLALSSGGNTYLDIDTSGNVIPNGTTAPAFFVLMGQTPLT